jgi:hypothetical protein
MALYTVVYPGVESYLPDWYASVRAQTDTGFDLWISTDGLAPAEAVAAAGRPFEARWLPAAPGSSPASLRSAALEELTSRYDAVVLVDSDDLLEATRIEAARAGLAGADVVGCALRIVDAAGASLGPILGPVESSPDWGEFLARHNVFGLSNTAYRADLLRRCLPIPADVVLVDWLLALRAWAADAALRFDREPRMRYRQHPANTARVLPPFSEAYVLRATDLVVDHYRTVLGDGGGIGAGRTARVGAVAEQVLAFRQAVRGSDAVLRRYVAALNRLEPRYVWWWCVANPVLEGVWSN